MKSPIARGLLFAAAFAAATIALRGAASGLVPDLLLIGVGLTAYFFSWIPALALYAVSLAIAQYTAVAPVALHSVVALGMIVGFQRLRTRDVTARKRAEEALLQSEALTRSVVYSAVDGIITIDAAGAVRSFNPGAERLFGYAAEEVIGRNVNMLMPSPYREEHDRYIGNYLETGRKKIIGIGREVAGLRKDGSTFPIDLAVSEMQLAGGRMFTGIIRDISERKQAEEALERANETLRAVIETSPLAIITLDLGGNVRTWNPAAERIFGWSERELLNRPFPVPPESGRDDPLDPRGRAQRGESVAGVEQRRLRKDGLPVDVSIWSALLRDREGRTNGVIGVAADITERKRLEEQLRQAQKMEAVGRLAGGIAHDFNNMLTVIGGFGEMALDRVDPRSEMGSEIGEILKAAEHATALTTQLLVFSRHQVVESELLNLNEVVTRLDKMLRRVIGEHIELVTVAQEGLGQVRADAGQIEQVLMNLVLNARDAMPDGGRLSIETANVELDSAYVHSHIGARPGPYVMLAVSDTGTGMTPEVRARLFEPFFTTKEKGKGTGLGLSTVYGIVKQSGGEIWVYSEVGRGSTFKVYLPRVNDAVQKAPPTVDVRMARGGETVLLAEDEVGVRKLVREILRKQGYRVLDAANSSEALRLCEQHPGEIDLLVTDVVMPEMSGRELAERAVAVRPGLKVLYMSGYTDDMIVHQGVLALGTPFLQKPFTPGVLARKVREVLDGGRASGPD